MKRLIVAGVLAVLGIICILLPLSYTMTGLCLLALAAVCALTWLLDRKNARPVWKESLMVLTLVGILLLQSVMGALYGVGMGGTEPGAAGRCSGGFRGTGQRRDHLIHFKVPSGCGIGILEANPSAKSWYPAAKAWRGCNRSGSHV